MYHMCHFEQNLCNKITDWILDIAVLSTSLDLDFWEKYDINRQNY